MLELPERLGGNYVDVIDGAKLVAASADRAVKVRRWRVNDNLPGTRYFCPVLLPPGCGRRSSKPFRRFIRRAVLRTVPWSSAIRYRPGKPEGR